MHFNHYMANRFTRRTSIEIGSLSGPNFTTWTANMDCSRITLGKFLFQNIASKENSSFSLHVFKKFCLTFEKVT